MMKKSYFAILLACACVCAVRAANMGSCESAAKALTVTASEQVLPVTFTKEYYTVEGGASGYDASGAGVYYFKFTAKRGCEYSVWLTDESTNEVVQLVSVAPAFGAELFARFNQYQEGDVLYYWLSSTSWFYDARYPQFSDPASAVFYVHVAATSLSATAKLHYMQGNGLPLGCSARPLKLSPSMNEQNTAELALLDYTGRYYFTFDALAGRKYVFQTSGGTEHNELDFQFGDFEDPGVYSRWPTDACNSSAAVIPTTAGETQFFVEGPYTNDTCRFRLRYKLLPTRTIADHAPTPIALGDELSCVPGHFSTPETDAYDELIDEQLFSFTAAKGARYCFETVGARTNLLIAVYNEKGNVVTWNDHGNGYGFDTRLAFTATSAGTWYVGVCEDLEDDDGDTPTYNPVTLRFLSAETQDGQPDAWDPADDVNAGATPLSPVPGTKNDDPKTLDAAGTPVHELGVTDWCDTFMIAARQGLTYRISATADGDVPDLTLAASVYMLNARGAEQAAVSCLNNATNNINPGAEKPLEFTATANATYYIRVSVAEGAGLGYRYRLHASAYDDRYGSAPLGILKVDAKGAKAATWWIDRETVKYPNGSSILVGGSHTVSFSAVAGFSTPAAVTRTVAAGTVPTVVEVKYSDTSDPKDDTPAGAVAWALRNTETTFARTLWEGDVDHFSFTSKDGQYFDIALRGVEGDASFSITNAELGVLASNTQSVHQLALPATKAKYYLVVDHNGPVAGEGGYTLAGYFANVGAIKFGKTALSQKENAANVAFTVKRTAKDGRVRVKYGTVAGTARPGKEYIAQNGILEWANGDSKDKTVTVKLIPDLRPAWEAQNKVFGLRIEPIPDAERADDEYAAQISGTNTAYATLTEVSRQSPGTIAVTGYENGAVHTDVTTPKKVAATVTAGRTLTLNVARTDGSDGAVAVSVVTANGRAMLGTDFGAPSTNLLEWADGETGEKSVEIPTTAFAATGSWVESKPFTVKLAKVAKNAVGVAYGNPAISSASVAVTLESELMSQSLETHAKGIDRNAGVSVKAAKAGTWYVSRETGDLQSVPLALGATSELTWTLKGPGLIHLDATSCAADFTIEYLFGTARTYTPCDGDVKMIVPSGSKTLKLKFTATTADAVARLKPLAVGETPYRWLSFADPEHLPYDKATILCEGEDTFSWTVPAAAAAEGVIYRLVASDNARSLGADESVRAQVTVPEAVPARFRTESNAGKTCSWRVDFALPADEPEWVAGAKTWTFTIAPFGAEVAPSVKLGSRDAYGNSINGSLDAGEAIKLVQGVKVDFALVCGPDSSLAVAAGKLPDGLKLAQDRTTKIWSVTGVPTKAGSFTALMQATCNRIKGLTRQLDFEVSALDFAVGTFNGVVAAASGAPLTNNFPKLGSFTLTTTAQGRITAKAMVAGTTYSFTGTGFERATAVSPEDAGGLYRTVSAELEQVLRVGTASYTNRLELVLGDGVSTNLLSLGAASQATVRLACVVPNPDRKTVQEGIVYDGRLFRDNSRVVRYTDAAAVFAGYYTVALPATATEAGKPQGCGYLTVTLDAKGGARVAGQLADGTAISASVKAGLVGDLSDPESCLLFLPIYQGKSPYCFGGELCIGAAADPKYGTAFIAAAWSTLDWCSDNAAATYAGESGWSYTLVPSGGWYDTLLSLQTYYLGYEFAVGAPATDDLPDELLAAGYDFVASTSPDGLAVDVTGDAVSVEKQKLVKQDGSRTLNDFAASVNPAAVTVAFKRPTGLLSGTFSVWTEGLDARGNTVQKTVTGFKHQGVLVLVRDALSPLPANVWTAGYCLAPAAKLSKVDPVTRRTTTRSYVASLPFYILATDLGLTEDDWWAPDWGEKSE